MEFCEKVPLDAECGHTLHLLGPSGTPHEGLSVRSNHVHNLPDLRLEAHVQHPVGLVQDKVGAAVEVHLPRLQEVDQTTWRRDHYLTAWTEK